MMLVSTWLPAATIGEERMVSLTQNDGLTGETVHSMITDHNGLTWIATNSGVNVYNGKTMDSFRIENTSTPRAMFHTD